MPAIRDAVGGFEARDDPQVATGVSQNLFPELLEGETQFQPKKRVAMLPTHGFRRFATTPAPVTGMTGTRERLERLAVADGATIRVYGDPDAPAGLAALDMDGENQSFAQTIWPVTGAFAVQGNGNEIYYVGANGHLYRKVSGQDPTVAWSDAELTFRGLAGSVAHGPSGRLWLSCVEDTVVRCLDRLSNGRLQRNNFFDLQTNTERSSVQQPESLYWYNPDALLAVVDALGGSVTLFHLSGQNWTAVSQPLARNTLSLQLAAGSPDTRRPVFAAGVHLDGDLIRVIDRSSRRVVTMNRATGEVTASTPLPATIQTAGRACGFVGNVSAPHVYIDSGQSGGGRAWRLDTGAQWATGLAGGAVSPDAQPRTPIFPADDAGRYLGWIVDRQLHLVDLRENRVIPRVHAGINGFARSGDRLVGVDAPRGTLRASPPQLVVTSEAFRVGVLDAAGQVVVPGANRANSSQTTSVYVGARHVLAVTERHDLWRYDRSDMDAPPVLLGSAGQYIAVCATGGTTGRGRCVLVSRSAGSTTSVDFNIYNTPPRDGAEILAPDISVLGQAVPAGMSWTDLVDVAASQQHVFAIFNSSDSGSTLRSAVYAIPGGGVVSALSTLHLPGTWGPPSNVGYDNVVALDFSAGVLRGAITSSAGQPTIINALAVNSQGNGYSRVPARDIVANVNRRPRSLSHDSKYLYEVADRQAQYFLPNGTPTRAVSVASFWNVSPRVQSQFRWDPREEVVDGSGVVVGLRGTVYAFTPSSLRVYQPAPGQDGFPFQLLATRDVGICGPHAFGIVKEVMFWFDRSGRLWRITHDGDTTPDPVVSPAAEDALQIVGDLSTGLGLVTDAGGHPAFVCGWRDPGLTLAYDMEAEAWHTRTSLRLGTPPADSPFPWQRADQGASRVEHAANWRGRQFFGGFGSAGGIVAEDSTGDWRDIDGGAVQRVRQFGGLDAERRIVKHPVLRVDVTYGQGVEDLMEVPTFSLFVSNDGGRTFRDTPRVRRIGKKPPRAFYRLGSSQFRVYRVECESPIPFTMLGAFNVPPPAAAGSKF